MQGQRFRHLLFVEKADVSCRKFQRFDQFLIDGRTGGGEFFRCRSNLVRGDRGLVELVRKIGKRLVAIASNGFDDRDHLVHEGAQVVFRALQEIFALGFVQLIKLVDRNRTVGHSISP